MHSAHFSIPLCIKYDILLFEIHLKFTMFHQIASLGEMHCGNTYKAFLGEEDVWS